MTTIKNIFIIRLFSIKNIAMAYGFYKLNQKKFNLEQH